MAVQVVAHQVSLDQPVERSMERAGVVPQEHQVAADQAEQPRSAQTVLRVRPSQVVPVPRPMVVLPVAVQAALTAAALEARITRAPVAAVAAADYSAAAVDQPLETPVVTAAVVVVAPAL